MRLPSLPLGRNTPIIFFVILPGFVLLWSNGSADFFVTVFVAFSFFYALRRPHSIEKYVKQGLEQAVIEFETVKKIIPLILSISILSIVFVVIRDWGYTTSVLGVGLFMSVAISGLVIYALTISKKEFRFYLAKTCFTTALDKRGTFKQMRYFDMGLQEYNRYLKRHLKHQIKDIDKVFSKVSLLDNDAKNEVICTLSNSFKIETETDRLKPLRCISSELMKSEDIESVLVPESLQSQLKVIGTFLAASIPIVIYNYASIR